MSEQPETPSKIADALEAYRERYSGEWSSACPTISWSNLGIIIDALRLATLKR